MNKGIKELLWAILVVIGIWIIATLLLSNGGSIVHDGLIDEEAYSKYAQVCDVETSTTGNNLDSPYFITRATKFDLFSDNPPKVLVIDADGSAYISRAGLGGDWDPKQLYDVQLIACVGEENSAEFTAGCNGNSYRISGRTLNVYEARTGKWQQSFVLTSEDPCRTGGDQSTLEYIRMSIDSSIQSRQSMYEVVQ